MGVFIMRHQAGGEGGVVVLGGADGGIGLDRIGIDGIGLGDALGQRRQLDRLEEGDELRRVGFMLAGGRQRRAGIDIVVEGDERARHARLIGEIDEQLRGAWAA